MLSVNATMNAISVNTLRRYDALGYSVEEAFRNDHKLILRFQIRSTSLSRRSAVGRDAIRYIKKLPYHNVPSSYSFYVHDFKNYGYDNTNTNTPHNVESSSIKVKCDPMSVYVVLEWGCLEYEHSY